MTIILSRRNGIDPAKISGPYSLLAVMLLVTEILFAIWFYKAQSSAERSIAGSILAVVFISLMLLIMRMSQDPEKEKQTDKVSYREARATIIAEVNFRKIFQVSGFISPFFGLLTYLGIISSQPK